MKKTNSMSLAGLIISGVSLVLNYFGVVSIIAIILSAKGLQQCKSTGENGKDLAIIGLIIGIGSLIYNLILLAIVIMLMLKLPSPQF